MGFSSGQDYSGLKKCFIASLRQMARWSAATKLIDAEISPEALAEALSLPSFCVRHRDGAHELCGKGSLRSAVIERRISLGGGGAPLTPRRLDCRSRGRRRRRVRNGAEPPRLRHVERMRSAVGVLLGERRDMRRMFDQSQLHWRQSRLLRPQGERLRPVSRGRALLEACALLLDRAGRVRGVPHLDELRTDRANMRSPQLPLCCNLPAKRRLCGFTTDAVL